MNDVVKSWARFAYVASIGASLWVGGTALKRIHQEHPNQMPATKIPNTPPSPNANMSMTQEGIERAMDTPPAWLKEPAPVHRTESPEYWQQWCRMKYGTPEGGPGFRQDALDWAQHCTEAGDANGK